MQGAPVRRASPAEEILVAGLAEVMLPAAPTPWSTRKICPLRGAQLGGPARARWGVATIESTNHHRPEQPQATMFPSDERCAIVLATRWRVAMTCTARLGPHAPRETACAR